MGWVKVAGKALEYSGKVAQPEDFKEWASQQGQALLEKITQEQGLKVFAETRARKILWQELQAAASSDALRAAFQDEVEEYQRIPGRIAADKGSLLPKSGGYRSLFAVPRYLINRSALENIRARLDKSDELARLSGEPLKEYLFLQLVREMDRALVSTQPSSKDPFPSNGNWLMVGFDENFRWGQNPDLGHYLLYEPAEGRLARSDRRDVDEKVSNLESTLGRLSAEEKEAFIKPFDQPSPMA